MNLLSLVNQALDLLYWTTAFLTFLPACQLQSGQNKLLAIQIETENATLVKLLKPLKSPVIVKLTRKRLTDGCSLLKLVDYCQTSKHLSIKMRVTRSTKQSVEVVQPVRPGRNNSVHSGTVARWRLLNSPPQKGINNEFSSKRTCEHKKCYNSWQGESGYCKICTTWSKAQSTSTASASTN